MTLKKDTPCQGGCGKFRSVLFSDSPADWLCNDCRTKRTHYVYGSGEHGCLYDNCGATETFQDAVDSLAETFELGRTRKSRLLANRYLELRPADGAAYCEISECSCLRPWDHSEIDEPENWPDYPQPISCDQCQMLSINGIACHETGCPNMGARWDSESGEWIKQRKCFTCGYTVDADSECCNGETDDEAEG